MGDEGDGGLLQASPQPEPLRTKFASNRSVADAMCEDDMDVYDDDHRSRTATTVAADEETGPDGTPRATGQDEAQSASGLALTSGSRPPNPMKRMGKGRKTDVGRSRMEAGDEDDDLEEAAKDGETSMGEVDGIASTPSLADPLFQEFPEERGTGNLDALGDGQDRGSFRDTMQSRNTMMGSQASQRTSFSRQTFSRQSFTQLNAPRPSFARPSWAGRDSFQSERGSYIGLDEMKVKRISFSQIRRDQYDGEGGLDAFRAGMGLVGHAATLPTLPTAGATRSLRGGSQLSLRVGAPAASSTDLLPSSASANPAAGSGGATSSAASPPGVLAAAGGHAVGNSVMVSREAAGAIGVHSFGNALVSLRRNALRSLQNETSQCNNAMPQSIFEGDGDLFAHLPAVGGDVALDAAIDSTGFAIAGAIASSNGSAPATKAAARPAPRLGPAPAAYGSGSGRGTEDLNFLRELAQAAEQDLQCEGPRVLSAGMSCPDSPTAPIPPAIPKAAAAFDGPTAQAHPPREQLPEGATLEFITDVEGNWEYLKSLVERSTILRWMPGQQQQLELASKGYLVFGGDVMDRGPGDIRVARVLLALQQRHPTRVFLLAGNRDVNKLRLAAELASEEWPDRDPIRYIDPNKQSYEAFLAERRLKREPFTALQWILEKTMGAPGVAEMRRQELKVLSGAATAPSDEQVLQSFRDSVDPAAADPWVLQYLRVAQVMVVIGDCLFVHGAVLSKGLLLVPAEDTRDGCPVAQPPPLRLADSTPIESWAQELNSWKYRQLRLFEAFPQFRHGPNGDRWRGGGALMMPSLSGCHVITDGFLKDNNAAALDDDVAKYLARQGIRRVFAGHQPQGECPGVMRSPRAGITVLVADTSYSNPRWEPSQDPTASRGVAVSTVTVRRDETIVEGILGDGTQHGYTLSTDWALEQGAAGIVGRRLVDGSWGQTVTMSGQVLTRRGEPGFKQILSKVSLVEAHSRVDPAFATRNDARRAAAEPPWVPTPASRP